MADSAAGVMMHALCSFCQPWFLFSSSIQRQLQP
eukprot:COSAG01_NODE_11364_length_1951_cov_5.172786_1_plen_34_part_00